MGGKIVSLLEEVLSALRMGSNNEWQEVSRGPSTQE